MPVDNIDKEKCIGCETCVWTCPMDVFRMDAKAKKSVIRYPEDYQICHLCRVYCPENAITITPVKCLDPMVGWG